MPSQVAKIKKSTGTIRSRTGCQTCRTRKLKCDEQRPICGQCQKSHRECVRSEAITFRHHQNSSFGKDGQDHNLDSFFKYSQTYTEDDLRGFLPIPKQLTWIHVSDPTADDPNASPPPQTPGGSESYQQVAAHSLEALSTAAADQTSYPPQGTAYYTTVNPQTDAHPEYGFVQAEPAGVANGSAQGNVNYFLGNNASQNITDTSLIDPNLEVTVGNGVEQTVEMGVTSEAKQHVVGSAGQQEQEDVLVDTDSRVAMALRNYNELQA